MMSLLAMSSCLRPDLELGTGVLTNPSPIKSVTPLYEGKTVLKLGIFPKIPTPEWESFSGDRQAWEKSLDGTVQYKGKSFGEKME